MTQCVDLNLSGKDVLAYKNFMCKDWCFPVTAIIQLLFRVRVC